MTAHEKYEFAQSLSEAERQQINWWLIEYARPHQLPPPGDWFVWFLRSGRGFGKTRTGAEWVIHRAHSGFRRIALVGQTKADARDTMIEVGESSILNISPPHFMPEYQPTKRRLVWPNGALALVYSGDEPDQLRGPQHDTAWVDELAKFKYPQQTWDNLMFGLRIGAQPQVCVTTTPRPLKLIKKLIAQQTTRDIRRSSYDNIANLSPVYVEQVLRPYEGTRLGRQEIGGEILDDAPGALWKRDNIEDHRTTKHPPLDTIVVGVDPTATSTGDEAGIIVAGKARLGDVDHLYVLGDASRQGSPLQWGSAAVAEYHKFKGDGIIAESNNGGEMVALTIGTVPEGRNVPVELIHASRGKRTRAEPIAAIYEQGRGHHVGTFPQLEDEMCQWEPGDDSPNRMDALVWAASRLMLDNWGGSVSVLRVPWGQR